MLVLVIFQHALNSIEYMRGRIDDAFNEMRVIVERYNLDSMRADDEESDRRNGYTAAAAAAERSLHIGSLAFMRSR